MKGTYALIIRVPRPLQITIGALGTIPFRPGFYVYVGSAQNSLEKRIARHLRKRKKLRWHIDYLLSKVPVLLVIAGESGKKEVEIGRELLTFCENFVPGFGSSDSPLPSHLFYFSFDPRELVVKIFKKCGISHVLCINPREGGFKTNPA